MKNKIKVGITMGDPSGIGPEIIIKALPSVSRLAEFIVIGDRKVFDRAIKPGDGSVFSNSRGHLSVPYYRLKNRTVPKFLDLNNVNHKKFQFGKVRAEYGRASIEYLDAAWSLLRKKELDCLVTAPISKEAINLAGFVYSGHTEYFEKLANTKTMMMLLNKQLKFSLLTRHIALKDVPRAINQEKLSWVIRVTSSALKDLFGLKNPRIAVCGLNPHASDNGLIGKEENRIIKPAINKLKKTLSFLDGPIPADVAIKKAKQGQYDCLIAMYHDQALIPLKLLGGEQGVNLTVGLPFVRTSPLHGTAFDIADTNLASPGSLVAAIKLAIQCSLKQKKV